ncbi:ING1-like protein [Cryptosporidium canis]|uniref:ING1-like protein n=1 Tax=Cryptosporidium canis TaxID=195482 RepID=A0A9D5HV31_9CRYT|nr:ING1-like protein [Cryptosporidium canis]
MTLKNTNENAIEHGDEHSGLLPYSRILRVIKNASDKKFSKSSVQLIQCSVTEFIKEIAELSERQSRTRTGKNDKDLGVTIQKEDVIAAIQKGGKRFSFINFSAEFLEDDFWLTLADKQ